MKKLIVMLLSCFLLTGCSLIPRLTFDSPNTVPQSVDKSKVKEYCKGKAKWDENGRIISCSKGYYNYAVNYEKKERKMTVSERIKSFINNLAGFGFWGFVLIIILVPSLAGGLIGRFIEGTIGITGKTLRSIVRGVQKARKEGKELNTALATYMDEDTKKYVDKVKEQEKLK